MTNRSYKYRIYPTKSQASYLDQNFGAVRFVWNHMVANFNSWSSEGPNRPMSEKIIKDDPENPWLKDMISYGLQQKRMDFQETIKQYFNKGRKVKLGSPKFKKRGISNDSFRIPGQALGFNKCIDLHSGFIKMPKMTPIKIVIDRPFTGNLKSVTVSKNKVGQYFVSVLVEEDAELKPDTGHMIGIDLGLKDLLVASSCLKISNPRWFRKSQAELKKAQKHLSRKTKGSKRYEKQRLKVARIHLKIRNQRNYVYHVLSTWLVDNYDIICLEDLNVKGMVKNRKLAKSIQDAAWSSFVSMLAYKCTWYGKTFHRIDRFYPSSKTCSCCGHKMDSMTLDVREWTCPSCRTNHDRDLNAAVNILNKGLDDLYGLTSDELADYRRGEEVRPEVVLPKASSVKRLASFIDIYRTA